MIDINNIQKAMIAISNIMTQNREYLIGLDARNGDGDLGISMDVGFKSVVEMLESLEETDLGKYFLKISKTLNENAPSSLGTILSFAFMGMAKALKGKTTIEAKELYAAMDQGVNLIMEKAGSKPGEKTILDSLCPAIEALKNNSEETCAVAFEKAAKAAEDGSQSTINMRSVHGRAAYYGDKSIGVLDAGSVVGKLIFEAINSIV